jgi:hypothetical protein
VTELRSPSGASCCTRDDRVAAGGRRAVRLSRRTSIDTLPDGVYVAKRVTHAHAAIRAVMPMSERRGIVPDALGGGYRRDHTSRRREIDVLRLLCEGGWIPHRWGERREDEEGYGFRLCRRCGAHRSGRPVSEPDVPHRSDNT